MLSIFHCKVLNTNADQYLYSELNALAIFRRE